MKPGLLIAVALGLLALAQGLGQAPRTSQSTPRPESGRTSAQTNKGEGVRPDYVGDQACAACHGEKVNSFHRTAHFLTSREPSADAILGNFTPGANVLKTANAQLSYRMDRKEDGFFETAVDGTAPDTEEQRERIDLVIGSGGKGQTYGFWNGDQLFQLPVSYWDDLGWVNSPGYRDGVADFERPVVARCLECHGTYFESAAPPPNRYRKTGYVVGMTCEKCHRPGREHVEHERTKTAAPAESGILNPAKFSRERQVDLCAWCHAGHGIPLAKSFSYVPGKPIAGYFEFPKQDPGAQLDVHGNQVELLKRSRCFQASAMTCITCHDVHAVQHDPAVFSQRCLGCHKPGTAAFPKDHTAASNCIDCHMPKQDTNLIVFSWNGKRMKPQVRNHWIKVYPGKAQAH